MPDNEGRFLIVKDLEYCPVYQQGACYDYCGFVGAFAENRFPCEGKPCPFSITRAEAVERMAKALFYKTNPHDDWGRFKKDYSSNGFLMDAEAALDALLGGAK